ncbi:MAG: thymidine phosphorylase [Ruminococcaceae bacterium]|nr:thymidine phosphorylase [Oscillospiraceae bacterium]
MLKMQDIITKKQLGRELNEDEIEYFVKGVTDGSIPDYQISALLMAIWFRGMTEEETITLTECMTDSGEINVLSSVIGKKVDKHSTGGVGDKVSLIIGPMVAAANKGVYVPKMAGRGLGFTGGTLDKLESCTGVNTEISAEEFESIVRELGFCIAGQSKRLAPADSKLSAIRDVTGTANCIPLIAASVMSKKLASGSDYIVLDVKCGSGSFCKTMRDAEELARLMVRIGAREKRKTIAIITDMSAPLGCAVGNSVELIEAIRVLEGRGDEELTELCITLAANMLYAANVADYETCTAIVEETLYDGSALKKLAELVKRLGGDERYIYDTSLFEESNVTAMLVAEKSGYISGIDAYEVGKAAAILGAGREKIGAEIDHTAGIILNKRIGDRIEEGEALATLQAKTLERAQSGMEHLFKAVTISDRKPEEKKIILRII